MSKLTKYFTPIFRLMLAGYLSVAGQFTDWRAYVRKQRSIRQLQRLDDHLLDDIGLARVNDEIVSTRTAPIASAQRFHAQEVQLRTRARSQKRGRHRHLRRRLG